MPAEERPVRTDEEDRAVKRGAFAFDDPDDEVQIVPAGDRAEPVDGRSRNVDRRGVIAPEPLAAGVCAAADTDLEVGALRVAAHERLGEDGQPGAGLRGLSRKPLDAIERRVAVECDRGGLHDGDPDLPHVTLLGAILPRRRRSGTGPDAAKALR